MNNTTANSSFLITVSNDGLSWPLLIRSIITPCGVLTNFINICIFISPKLKDISYKYMLVNSITNFFYLVFCFMGLFFSSCINVNCHSSQTLFATIYTISIINYFTSSLAIFRILIEVTLSLHTYCILTQQKWLTKVSYKLILLILFIISLLFYLEQLFAYSIVTIMSDDDEQRSVVYTSVDNSFGTSALGKSIAVVQFSVRLFLVVVVLTLLNIMNVVQFVRRFGHRKIGILERYSNNSNPEAQNLGRSTLIFGFFFEGSTFITHKKNFTTQKLKKKILTHFFKIFFS